MNCKYCNKDYKNNNSLHNHERLCKNNPDYEKNSSHLHSNKGISRPSSRKGLTKENSDMIKKQSETCKKNYKTGKIIPHFLGKHHSEKTKELWAKNKKIGGRREGSGRGIKGRYLGYYCDSTWELAWLIYTLDQGKVPIRNMKGFPYKFKEKIRNYYPDFILDGEYFEIKGHKNAQWDAKFSSWKENVPLNVISLKDIQPYLLYSQNKFGKEFWLIAYSEKYRYP
jgi:hypothetical protein